MAGVRQTSECVHGRSRHLPTTIPVSDGHALRVSLFDLPCTYTARVTRLFYVSRKPMGSKVRPRVGLAKRRLLSTSVN